MIKKVKKMTFEKSMQELENILKDVENNNLTLDELVDTFERGVNLSTFCMEKLNNAKLKIEKLTKSQNKIKLEKLK